MNIKIVSLLSVGVLTIAGLGFAANPVSAQSEAIEHAKEQLHSAREDAKNSREENRTATKQTRCTALTGRINGRRAAVNASLNKQAALYASQDARIKALIVKAQAAGADTTKLETDLSSWESQTAAIVAARNQVITELDSLQSIQCVDQKAQYKQVLSQVKAEIKNIHSLQVARKAFYKSTIKPDLQTIRDQLKQQ